MIHMVNVEGNWKYLLNHLSGNCEILLRMILNYDPWKKGLFYNQFYFLFQDRVRYRQLSIFHHIKYLN